MSRTGLTALVAGLVCGLSLWSCALGEMASPPDVPALVQEIRALNSPLIDHVGFSPPDMMEGLTIDIGLSVELSEGQAREFYCGVIAPVVATHQAEYPDVTVLVWDQNADRIQSGTFERCP